MQHQFIDRTCATFEGARRSQPFGPDTVVWKVNGHMFAAYTEDGTGVSVRTDDVEDALRLIKRSRPATARYLTGGGWVVLPWEAPPDALRQHLMESYALVLRDWPSATPAR